MAVVVRECLRKRVLLGGERHSGWLPDGAARPPDNVAVSAFMDLHILRQQAHAGFLLTYKITSFEGLAPSDIPRSGDTWHAHLEDALEQANADYGVEKTEWSLRSGVGQ